MQIRDIQTENLIHFPHLFNAAIFKYRNKNYICYRANVDLITCRLLIAETDNNWNPLNAGLGLVFPNRLNFLYEDPRFFLYQENPYLSISQVDLKLGNQHQLVVKLDPDTLQVKEIIKPDYGKNLTIREKIKKHKQTGKLINIDESPVFEKNWIFFEQGEDLLCIYKTQPHFIIGVFDSNLDLKKEYLVKYPKFNWAYGEIRGGCGIKIGEDYYHFFHSSFRSQECADLDIGRIYSIGCIKFKLQNDEIVDINYTKIPLEVGNIYDEVVLWKNAVVFPCGVVYENGRFFVSYGWHDHSIKLMEITIEELNSRMTEKLENK